MPEAQQRHPDLPDDIAQPDLFFEKPSALSKSQRRQARKKRRAQQQQTRTAKPFNPLNETQEEYFDLLGDQDVTQIFAVGEAGSGKTYIPARFAMKRLLANTVDRILIARPTVSTANHRQGFLPGKLQMKLAPWLVPIMDAFKEEASAKTIDQMLQQGRIEFLSFEHMRGRTFGDSFVILDEAQNCTLADLRMFLTRKGENSTYVIAGDPSQADIANSGLNIVLDIIEKYDLSPEIIEFDALDVVRSRDAREWVEAFRKHTA